MHSRLLCTAYETSRFPYIFRQFLRQSSFLGKMKRGRNCSPTPSGNSEVPPQNAGDDSPSIGVVKQPESLADPAYDSASIGSGSKGKRRNRSDLRTQPERNIGSAQHETPPTANSTSQHADSSLPTSFGKKYARYSKIIPELHQTSQGSQVVEQFDICLPRRTKSSSRKKNRESRIEMENSVEETGQILRPGMVLLKSYITLSEQVEIVKKCRKLGLGPGGFYQPGYQDGAKLRLQMMCLGMNWDPQTKYDKQSQSDGSEPPGIPENFVMLVKKAILDSHVLIEKHLGASNVEDTLPGMSPNICIVNFYGNNGRLGLHKDRDESRESLDKGLPVVSVSVGDSAEFLYGDDRDVNKAERVLLESGDVLIFGGQSRHIFHGVSSILLNSAPRALLKKARLRPGRLNLTFRQY